SSSISHCSPSFRSTFSHYSPPSSSQSILPVHGCQPLCASCSYWAPTDLGSSPFSILSFAFSYCSWGSQGKNTEVVCHSLLQLSSVATGEFLPPEALKEMKANLIKFLPFKYLAKELTSQAEILKKVLRDNQEHFPVVFSQASHCLELVCGVEVKEVDPREHIYIMVPNLGLTCDVMLSSGHSMPKAGLLVLILSLIMQNGDRAPEEKVWGALSRLGVCVRSVHCVFGEPRTLLTHVWVQEGYLEYRQVPYSYPARYEFLWGPRAYAETSKRDVMAFLLRIKERASRAFPPLSAEAAREEDEAA
ncbi:unnamed protein product, partial [Rangifer tarandus platyrhynchus]